MEVRPDTSSSSGRFRGQWSFLANPPQHQQPRSRPPSSYILHSERSSISPLPTGLNFQTVNGSRSSLHRNITTASIGGRSAATIPSQPVLIRVHSADASAHTNPAPRPMRPVTLNKNNGLPAMSEFSIQGILAAIQEDVEQDINTISEILGRSRLVLADQHDSHMPPQGEIRAMPQSLQVVEEASSSNEQLATDDVLILRDDASLVNGSQAGSAAYGLLERLQAVPRADRANSDWPVSQSRNRAGDQTHNHYHSSQVQSQNRLNSSPAVLRSEQTQNPPPTPAPTHEHRRTSRDLLRSSATLRTVPRTTPATVSETHLLAEADGAPTTGSRPLTNHDLNRSLLTPYDYDFDYEHDHNRDGSGFLPSRIEHDEYEDINDPIPSHTFRERMQHLLYVSDPTGLNGWLQGQSHSTATSNAQTTTAEGHLRELLER